MDLGPCRRDLATALGQPNRVQPGDTLWLRGGTYRGSFSSSLSGTPTAPIVVRQFGTERATIDGHLDINGADAIFWGFEVTSSDPAPPDREGVSVFGARIRCINMVSHDNGGNGFGVWEGAVDAEIYGGIVYNNGRQREHAGFAHGIYAQNRTGAKQFVDNVLFNQLGYGFHIYGESGGT